jgi:hypothetical protein
MKELKVGSIIELVVSCLGNSVKASFLIYYE